MDKHSLENRILKTDASLGNDIHEHFSKRQEAASAFTTRIRVYGIVQGVGFRPAVSRHAAAAGIRGTVCNKGPYVEIIAQGSESECHAFLELMKKQPPKRASIIKIDVKELAASSDSEEAAACADRTDSVPLYRDFSIIESEQTHGDIYISPDIAICESCRRELFDKTDRRYLHPFINCTDCGPRMTILDALPYDRERTSMKMFPMCDKCSEEYHSPKSRRYDAQPVCCNNCGPGFYILDKNTGAPSAELKGRRAISHARKIIAEGGIIGIKGIGGFHLCCDAGNENAVSLLRSRKHRPAKPFAVMMRDIETVKRVCFVSEQEEELLIGHQKPIVLLTKNAAAPSVAPSVAPDDNPKLGVMLPYAPIQLLLFDYDDGLSMPDCLIMTSANESGAPICRDDADALRELSVLADAILSNNRLIRIRADDTVTDFYKDEPYMIRRSRGFAPLPMLISALSDCNVSVIGMGGELKNSFCIGRGQLFYPSPYVGNLGDIRTVAALRETVQRFIKLLEVKPETICCDKHPLYQSRELAYELADELAAASGTGIHVFEIQHHYAHILSCMAENDCEEPIIGVSFDGTGYGDDKTIWGGEILISDWNGFERFSHISPFIQVGGDLSSKEGWRIAAQMIGDIYSSDAETVISALGLCSLQELKLINAMADRNINSVRSTSAGRLFDAVSAILGIKRASTFEGEASTALMYRAMEYEDGLKRHCPYNYPLLDNDGLLNTRELVRYITDERLKAENDPCTIAGLSYVFHEQLAEMLAESVSMAAGRTGIKTAALSGGVFQNTLFLKLTEEALSKRNIKVLRHHLIPPNDGGIGLGQAVYAMKHIGGL